MNITKAMRNLADQNYFRGIIDRLEQRHIRNINTFQLDSNQMAYHVPVEYARVTSLVFLGPLGSAIVINAKLTEIIWSTRGYRNPHWSLDVDSALKEEYILSNVEENIVPDLRESIRDFPQVWANNFYAQLRCPNFKRHGGAFNSRYQGQFKFSRGFEQEPVFKQNRLSTQSFANSILRLVDQIKHYAPAHLLGLNASSFPPSFQFPGCEKLFWSQFPTKELENIVSGDIWGGKVPNWVK